MVVLMDKSERIAIDRMKISNRKRKEYFEIIKGFVIDDFLIDYIVVCNDRVFVIERKTISDLYSSVIDGRLWKQLELMKELNFGEKKHYYILIVEGYPYGRFKDLFRSEWWLGVQVGVIKMGIFLIRTKSYMETLRLLKKLDDGNKGYRIVHRKKILNDVEDERILMLCGVNGVGVKKAQKLLEYFGSVKNVVIADRNDLEKVLGEKLANHFYDVVNKECDKK